MAEPHITHLDLASWLRKARRQPDPIAWLDKLNDDATAVVAAGDEFVSVTSDEGGSATASRNVDARFVQHVTELCLQRLEAEAEATAAGTTLTGAGSVRYTDFSR